MRVEDKYKKEEWTEYLNKTLTDDFILSSDICQMVEINQIKVETELIIFYIEEIIKESDLQKRQEIINNITHTDTKTVLEFLKDDTKIIKLDNLNKNINLVEIKLSFVELIDLLLKENVEEKIKTGVTKYFLNQFSKITKEKLIKILTKTIDKI